MTDNLDQLVTRASAGDAPALDALLERELPRLRVFIRMRAGPHILGRESASDLVQSVCREILEQLPSHDYRGEVPFRSWLYTAALRKILDRGRYWKRARRDPAREAAPPPGDGEEARELLASFGHVFTPSRNAILHEELERVIAALDRLSDEQREALALVRVVGLSYADAAAALGRSEAWCRTQVSRGLAKLSLVVDPP